MLAEFLFSKSVFSPPQTRAAGVVRELAAIAVALG